MFKKKKSSGEKDDPELFAVAPLTEFALPDQTVLARNPRSGRKMQLPLEVMTAMTHCDSFRTLEEHVQVFMEEDTDQVDRENALTSVIESVHKGGLTISAKEICAGLVPEGDGKSVTEQPVVAIITCDRPQALKRLLESFLRECDLSQVRRFFVLDDSRLTENKASNLEITQHFNGLADIDIRYFGEIEAYNFMTSLIQRLPDHEEQIRFLIDRERWKDYVTAGIARNYGLLMSVGNPVIIFDDDTICKAYEPPIIGSEIEFSDRNREAYFFKSHDERQGLNSAENPDPVKQHMRCLGLLLSEALNVLGTGTPDQNSLRYARSAFATKLNHHSRILITECGALGDPGTISNNWLATLPIESRERLQESESQFENALNHRNCWLGRSHATFTPAGNFSGVTGVDNRQFLPPYFPIERGEDLIFGKSVNFIFPDSICLNYAWAVPHLPIPERQWSEPGKKASIPTLSSIAFIEKIVDRKDLCQAEDPHLRVEFLAQILKDFAGSPKASVLNQFAEDWLEHKIDHLSVLQTKLEESAGAPPFWIDYLQRSIQQTQASMLDEADLSRMTPSSGTPGGEEVIEFWQSVCGSFGQSLLAWREIRREARSVFEAQFQRS